MLNEIQEKEKQIKKRGRKPKTKEIIMKPPLIVIKEICFVEF